MKNRNKVVIPMLLLGSSFILGGCSSSSSSGGGTPPPPTTVNVAGSVSAPGGSVAFYNPSITERIFAMFVGAPAYAAISGVLDVGAGVTVNLIEVDAAGAQVGAVIATATTTAGGAYSLDAPEGFTPGPQYVIRAEGGGGAAIEARVTSTSVNVDPISEAASNVVTSTASDLGTLTNDEVDAIQNAVDDVSQDINPAGQGVDALAASLQTEAASNEESSNVINSTVTSGTICGTVTDSAAAGIANVDIAVSDFGNWVTRARTKTAADGTYCLNVPVQGDSDPDTGGTFSGEYILGAFNRTDDSNDSGLHASEWWSTGGTAYNKFDAEMIMVANTTTVTKDLQLEPGARITGSVTADGTGASLEGVKVVIRDFDNRTPVASARVKADGSYRVNVIPGKYLVVARNKTIQPYASEIYDGGTGTNNRNLGAPVTVATGGATTLDFVLEAGYMLNGSITDGGTAVTGMRVMVNSNSPGGPAERVRTNKQGNYRIWLRPATYRVYAYGQRNLSVDLTTSDQTLDFSATVNAISATLQDSGGSPVSQTKFRLYDTANNYLGFEVSSSDGTVTMYTDQTGDHRVQIRIDRAASAGSSIYDGQTQLANATLVNTAGGDVALGVITLPDGGVLTGTVYAGSSGDTSTPIGNFSVEVRDGGTAGANRFTRVKTRGDGSYVLTLPAGTYERVKMRDATGNGNCDSITVIASATTTVNYFDGDNTCVVTP
ncbi:MAG: hypothetical protein BMS9Abin36_1414 [Gammaproteobacteria bacterium]|nr:MAG: hypothetical protein BMS9Abin36_1414 [Gammaproteobacteria bacterium]